MRQGYKRRKRKHNKLVFLFLGEIVIVVCLIFLIFWPQKVHRKVTVEAGTKTIDVSLFLKRSYKGKFLTDITTIDFTKIGEQTIVVMVDGKEYSSVLLIQDTIAPKAIGIKVTGALGVKIHAIDCVDKIQDATKVTATFHKEPDWEKAKTQPIEVTLKDEGGNKTTVKAWVVLVEDTEPPVITGVQDQFINLKATISYKTGVEVTDNQDPKPELTIDTSKVDLNTEGSYPVQYIATDQAGNRTTVTAIITVMSQTNLDNRAEMDNLADAVLEKIVTDGMTKIQIAKAIYTWTNKNINYTNESDKSSWVSGAIQGMKTRSGDCFQYFSVAKALLTRAGIENVDIIKSDVRESSHFWSLVNIGDGYYHFDTTPRKGEGDYFFMVTDEQLETYSKAHENSHIYDSSLYPDRATTPIQE